MAPRDTKSRYYWYRIIHRQYHYDIMDSVRLFGISGKQAVQPHFNLVAELAAGGQLSLYSLQHSTAQYGGSMTITKRVQ